VGWSGKALVPADDALPALAALAQQHRLEDYRLLVQAGQEEMAAGEVAASVGIAPNTLSFHFDRLRHAGLVTFQRRGRSLINASALRHNERADRLPDGEFSKTSATSMKSVMTSAVKNSPIAAAATMARGGRDSDERDSCGILPLEAVLMIVVIVCVTRTACAAYRDLLQSSCEPPGLPQVRLHGLDHSSPPCRRSASLAGSTTCRRI
jgi:DNA-binding transcriptional ArsR family regulator